MKPARTADQLRNAELARIHIARTQLGMDEDAYRDLLFVLERVRSAKDLDWGGRKRVLEHFKKLGWRPTAPKKAGAIRPVATGQPGMIVALWADLHAAGRVASSGRRSNSWSRHRGVLRPHLFAFFKRFIEVRHDVRNVFFDHANL